MLAVGDRAHSCQKATSACEVEVVVRVHSACTPLSGPLARDAIIVASRRPRCVTANGMDAYEAPAGAAAVQVQVVIGIGPGETSHATPIATTATCHAGGSLTIGFRDTGEPAIVAVKVEIVVVVNSGSSAGTGPIARRRRVADIDVWSLEGLAPLAIALLLWDAIAIASFGRALWWSVCTQSAPCDFGVYLGAILACRLPRAAIPNDPLVQPPIWATAVEAHGFALCVGVTGRRGDLMADRRAYTLFGEYQPGLYRDGERRRPLFRPTGGIGRRCAIFHFVCPWRIVGPHLMPTALRCSPSDACLAACRLLLRFTYSFFRFNQCEGVVLCPRPHSPCGCELAIMVADEIEIVIVVDPTSPLWPVEIARHCVSSRGCWTTIICAGGSHHHHRVESAAIASELEVIARVRAIERAVSVPIALRPQIP